MNGKGSRDRTKNFTAYQDNYSQISWGNNDENLECLHWDDNIIKKLEKENKAEFQFNFIRKNINSIALRILDRETEMSPVEPQICFNCGCIVKSQDVLCAGCGKYVLKN